MTELEKEQDRIVRKMLLINNINAETEAAYKALAILQMETVPTDEFLKVILQVDKDTLDVIGSYLSEYFEGRKQQLIAQAVELMKS